MVYPYGKLSHFKKLTVSQFIVIEYQSLQNVKVLDQGRDFIGTQIHLWRDR